MKHALRHTLVTAAASAAALVLISGCMSTMASTGELRSGGRDVLLGEEIDAAEVNTAWEAVQRLRPQMLRARGRVSIERDGAGEPVVYADGVRRGGLQALRSIRAEDIAEIRYLDARDATTRFGTGHAGGVIMVRTRGGS